MVIGANDVLTRFIVQNIAARRYPSTSKVQYLLHLRECHSWCANSCRLNALESRGISRKIELPATEYLSGVQKSMQAYHADLTYLADQLDAHVIHINEIKQLVTEQMDLFDKRRSRIIGFLIAIYVPLAFTTVSTCSFAANQTWLIIRSPSSV